MSTCTNFCVYEYTKLTLSRLYVTLYITILRGLAIPRDGRSPPQRRINLRQERICGLQVQAYRLYAGGCSQEAGNL